MFRISKLLAKRFILLTFALALILPLSREARSQDIIEYSLLATFISTVALLGLTNIENPGQAKAFTNLMTHAEGNTDAAYDGFESGNTSQEVSKLSASSGNLQAAEQMLDPTDERSKEEMDRAQASVAFYREAALNRLIRQGEDLCGNGVLDRNEGEECDNSSNDIGCPDGFYCLENCTCDQLR